MASIAHVTLLGHTGGGFNERQTQNGKRVANFSVAVNPSRDAEGNWYQVSVWGNYIDVIRPMFASGRKVMVVGTLALRQYEGNDGKARFSADVTASSVFFLDGSTTDTGAESADNSEDIPF